MSAIETVRQVYKLWEAEDLDGVLALASDDCVITQDAALPWGGRFVGRDRISAFMVGLYTTIQSTLTTEALFESDGQVIQMGRSQGSVIANGVTFDVPEIHIWTARGDTITAGHFAPDTAAMLEALAVGS